MKKLIFISFIACIPIQFTQATGMHTCDSGDKSQWQTKAQLEEKLISEGWKIRKIKEDGGCYEVYATNPQGQRAEAYFHPLTLELELMSRRGEILFRKAN